MNIKIENEAKLCEVNSFRMRWALDKVDLGTVRISASSGFLAVGVCLLALQIMCWCSGW